MPDHARPSRTDLRRSDGRHRGGGRPVEEREGSLGLLAAPDRQMAGPAVELIPARWTSIRLPVGQLHHARFGVTAKTVANHRSNVAAALRWFGKEYHVPHAGWRCRPSGLYCGMVSAMMAVAARLYGLMRYCSGLGLRPTSVDDAILLDYLRYRAETTSLAATRWRTARLHGRGISRA